MRHRCIRPAIQPSTPSGRPTARGRLLSNSVAPPSEATVAVERLCTCPGPCTHASSKRRTRGPSHEATVIDRSARLLSPPKPSTVTDADMRDPLHRRRIGTDPDSHSISRAFLSATSASSRTPAATIASPSGRRTGGLVLRRHSANRVRAQSGFELNRRRDRPLPSPNRERLRPPSDDRTHPFSASHRAGALAGEKSPIGHDECRSSCGLFVARRESE
jgi:hypothetical protein